MKNRKLIASWLHLVVCLIPTMTVCASPIDTTSLSTFSPKSLSGIAIKPRHSFKPITDFDQRFCYIENVSVSVWGYRIGVLVNDKYKLGLGGYFFNQQKNIAPVVKTDPAEKSLSRHAVYGTIYYEPYLIRKKHWELSTILEAGWGKVYTDSLSKTNESITATASKQKMVPVGVGLSAYLLMPEIKGMHFLTYFGLNGMIGVKKSLGASANTVPMDGLYWSISSAIFIDRIFSDIKNGKKKRRGLIKG